MRTGNIVPELKPDEKLRAHLEMRAKRAIEDTNKNNCISPSERKSLAMKKRFEKRGHHAAS